MSPDPAQPPRRPVSVLVVDDDPDIRLAFKDVLEDEGYSVAIASDGSDALAQLEALRPGLILLDLSMPGMSGEQFREVQLQDPSLAAIPTVVVSASGHIREVVARIRVTEWLEKPVDLDVLLLTVARFASPPA